RVRPCLAPLLERIEMGADRIEAGAFPQSPPCSHEPERRHAAGIGFLGRLENGLAVNEPVSGRAGLVSRGLGTEAAILGATAGFHVHDRAEVNLVALEMLANSIGPTEQVEYVATAFQIQEPTALGPLDLATCEHLFSQNRYACVSIGVNQFSDHG